MSAIGTKRTYRVALHMSASGGKRTSMFGAVMSAFDPKRTSGLISNRFSVAPGPALAAAGGHPTGVLAVEGLREVSVSGLWSS